MTSRDRDDRIEQLVAALRVHDVGAGSAARTRERCRAMLIARTAGRRRGRLLSGPRQWWAAASWPEPLAAVAAGALYLAAAVAASLTLLKLGPPR